MIVNYKSHLCSYYRMELNKTFLLMYSMFKSYEKGVRYYSFNK